MQDTVRFMEYINGSPVILKMGQHDSLVYRKHEQTDEGYASYWWEWQFDGEKVTCDYHTSGRDCDGSYSREMSSYFYVKDYHDAQLYPEWKRGSEEIRDFTAESMGY